MDPGSIAAAGIGSSLLGSLTGTFGAMSGGEAQSQMFQYQAGVAQLNKKIALQNADYSRATGEVQAQESGMKTAALLGTQKATQGAGGLAVNSGSNADVRSSTEDIGGFDQTTIRANAAKRAYGYEVEATQDESQSKLFQMAGDNALKAGKISALSSILGGASSVSSKWLQGNQQGLWGSRGVSGVDPDTGA